jgi:hypothetical protein
LVDDESLFDRSNSSEDDEYEDEDDEGLRLEVDKDRPFSDQYNSRDDPQVGALLQGSDSFFNNISSPKVKNPFEIKPLPQATETIDPHKTQSSNEVETFHQRSPGVFRKDGTLVGNLETISRPQIVLNPMTLSTAKYSEPTVISMMKDGRVGGLANDNGLV